MVLSQRAASRGVPIVVLALACVSACGGAGDGAPRPAAPAAGHPASTLSPGEWASWSHEQKAAYMKSNVLPEEKPLFAGYDANRFSDFTCTSCHGPSGEANGWKMPNPSLPKIAPGKIIELARQKPDVFLFMEGTVVPRTARLLGLPVWDHSTHTGFGCFNCHTVQK
jgi:hypothetical protein